MYRNELEAALSRIATLEEEIAQLKEHDRHSDRVTELSCQLDAERDRVRDGRRARRRRIIKRVAIGLGSAVLVVVTKPIWNGLLEGVSPGAAEQVYRLGCALGSGQDCSYRGVAAWRRNDLATFEEFSRRGCDRNNAQGCTNWAHTIKERDPDQYTAVVRKACDLGDAMGCNNYASDRSKHDDINGAITFGKRSCDKGSVLGCTNLAWYYLQAHRPADAQRTATEALRADSALVQAHMNVAYAGLIASEDDEEVVRELHNATEAAKVRRTQGEVEIFDRPIAIEIRDDLAKLKAMYADHAERIDKILAREHEWSN